MTEKMLVNTSEININDLAITKKRRRKQPHELYLCNSKESLIEALSKKDIDLNKLIFEFVKPKADPAIVVTGSIANGIATEVSDLDVIILLNSFSDLKAKRISILGNAVNYMPYSDDNKMEITMFISHIEVNLYFFSNEKIKRFFCADDPLSQVETVNAEDHFQMRFLGRLQNCWIIRNQTVVDQWKQYFQIDKFRISRITTEFTAATKNLEDLKASIGVGTGCVAMLGSSIISKALRALLAYKGFCFISGKWLRKVNQYIDQEGLPEGELFFKGRALVLPGMHETIDEEIKYFNEVYSYCLSVKAILESEQDIKSIMDTIIYDLDIMV
jgi:predicted nucleotidyltransferase